MNIADVPYAYIGANSTHKLEHFLVSQNLADYVLECSIIKNHLYSDIPITVTFDIDVVHDTVLERVYVTLLNYMIINAMHIKLCISIALIG